MAFGASIKDKAAIATVSMVLLYGMGAFFWFSQLTDKASNWNRSRRRYSEAVKTYARERALISKRAYWEDEYDEERSKMPMFPEGEDISTHWLNMMDSIASENHISLSSRQSGREEEVGDVFEQQVDVKNWEAALDPLVKFMYALEHAENAMFDIKTIDMRPSSHKGYLKGQFTLACAYMRGEPEDEDSAGDGGEENGK